MQKTVSNSRQCWCSVAPVLLFCVAPVLVFFTNTPKRSTKEIRFRIPYRTLLLSLTITSFAHAQIPVEKDPFHKIVFENQSVRVFDLQIGGHDTTTTHVHSAASVVVFVTKAALAIQIPGESPVITNVDPGQTIYRPYDVAPTTHKVWSADGSTMRCIVIEIKKPK